MEDNQDVTSPNVETGETSQSSEGFVQDISGEQVHFGPGLALSVNASQDATVSEAGAVGIVAGRDAQLSYGGSFAMVAGADMTVTNGGGTFIIAGGNVDITNGGAMMMNIGGNAEVTNGGALLLAGQQVTAERSFFGIVLAQQSNLGEGSRVLLDTRQAVAFGAALGAVFAVLSWIFKKK